ncbi:16S rRNA (guanine(966)-N(2))-methyltransferase RsmD [Caldimonas tepidiphila]|uniref:16S rRNA (guanine(966)-N(2))-methyltransferase RsmD n=1 Tax=Caldimonas tepidiphila TaxID=2315841 RepID=UPI000E5C1C52|nr:16S rRNA (guanine(966)-N(2))-methyltransferase RsmD [Caldimonas tepidiphila]
MPSRPAPRRPASSPPPREVRIIAGQWKRTKLPVADRPGLRPTMDRVRETLFNWLGQDLEGWRCLDAFAGTGALGFEAASRGAAEVLMIERDATLRAGLESVKARLSADAVQVLSTDALRWMQRAAPARFELVLLDPPFDAGVFDAALAAAAPLLVDGGLLYLEADRRLDDEAQLAALSLLPHRHGSAGSVHYHLFRRAAADSVAPRSPA